MKELRDYQKGKAKEGSEILVRNGVVYLAMEVRTGKTVTSLEIAKINGFKNILFSTKKKAIKSIQQDYVDFGFNKHFKLTVINDESLHLVENLKDFDLVIHDEHHRCFLGNTLINGVKIKDINVGSLQKSFNFDKEIYEYKKVLNVFKNPLNQNLIKIKCNGKEIICTETHEIFTKRGWVEARNILPTDELQVV